MPDSLWLDDTGIILNDDGEVIVCDECPCDGTVDVGTCNTGTPCPGAAAVSPILYLSLDTELNGTCPNGRDFELEYGVGGCSGAHTWGYVNGSNKICFAVFCIGLTPRWEWSLNLGAGGGNGWNTVGSGYSTCLFPINITCNFSLCNAYLGTSPSWPCNSTAFATNYYTWTLTE